LALPKPFGYDTITPRPNLALPKPFGYDTKTPRPNLALPKPFGYDTITTRPNLALPKPFGYNTISPRKLIRGLEGRAKKDTHSPGIFQLVSSRVLSTLCSKKSENAPQIFFYLN
jgi:hypothetical protein